MSRFDQDREELIRLIFSICDYARLGYSISTYNSCNNCRASGCKYKPKQGEAVRWNCPLWKGAENNKECHKPESLYYRCFCEERKDSAYCDGCEFWY